MVYYELTDKNNKKFLIYSEKDVERLKSQYDIIEVVKKEL